MPENWNMQNGTRTVHASFCEGCIQVAGLCPIKDFRKAMEELPQNADLKQAAMNSGLEVTQVMFDGPKSGVLAVCINELHPVMDLRGKLTVMP